MLLPSPHRLPLIHKLSTSYPQAMKGATKMTWTQPQDILNRWTGGDAPAENSPTLLTFIEDAEDLILFHYPRIQERIDNGELTTRRIQRVVASVVIRAYRSAGSHLSSYSESFGDASRSESYNNNGVRGLTLTSEELALLAPPKQQVYMLDLIGAGHSPTTPENQGKVVRVDGVNIRYIKE